MVRKQSSTSGWGRNRAETSSSPLLPSSSGGGTTCRRMRQRAAASSGLRSTSWYPAASSASSAHAVLTAWLLSPGSWLYTCCLFGGESRGS